MFQLIVSVIAIALVAILAAASIYYGGSAFTSSSTKGIVAQLINGGEQISGSEALYQANTGTTSGASDFSDLVPTYLTSLPVLPAGAGPWVNTGTAATATGINSTVCAAVTAPATCSAGNFSFPLN